MAIDLQVCEASFTCGASGVVIFLIAQEVLGQALLPYFSIHWGLNCRRAWGFMYPTDSSLQGTGGLGSVNVENPDLVLPHF